MRNVLHSELSVVDVCAYEAVDVPVAPVVHPARVNASVHAHSVFSNLFMLFFLPLSVC